MDFTKFTFSKKYSRNDRILELSFDFDIKEVTGRNSKTFDDYNSLLYFLLNNPKKQIFLTQTQNSDFCEENDKLVINLQSYQEFCKKIGQNGKNRTQAFLAQRLKNYSEDEKKSIISSSTEEEIIERIKNFTDEEKGIFLEKLKGVEGLKLPEGNIKNISNEEFLKAFSSFLTDPAKQKIVVANYPQIQINLLEEYKQFLEQNLDKEETFIQDWIDGKIDNNGQTNNSDEEEIKKIKKSRCLIFGLEFISHKREGQVSSKQFDILTRISQGKNDYVLIELKSPSSDVFKVKTKNNDNGGTSEEYHLSDDIARAIPQISEYRHLLDNASDIEWQRIGLVRGKISKCLIVIGTKRDDAVWSEHFLSLRKNLSSTIEILTYTDLIQKLETTIRNLRENL
ncbi:MAG: hypothetical protein US35_C0039G0002 [Parcubacteria group bacterium GW2011_GWA2_37_10]|nr:MAG: hypothetical protein US35_C0039G0002 [Parcubacteria group bacterium GW2011_GWA2_37_10]